MACFNAIAPIAGTGRAYQRLSARYTSRQVPGAPVSPKSRSFFAYPVDQARRLPPRAASEARSELRNDRVAHLCTLPSPELPPRLIDAPHPLIDAPVPSSSLAGLQLGSRMGDTVAQLKGLKELLDGGVLTQEEFDAQKTVILDAQKSKITQVAPAPVVGQQPVWAGLPPPNESASSWWGMYKPEEGYSKMTWPLY